MNDKKAPVKVTGRFWRERMNVVRNEVIPYQWGALNDQILDAEASHAIENFKIAAGESQGEFYGMVFQDSDVMKWLEAVAYSLETEPNPKLESQADAVIDLLGRAQQEDGYLDTYYIVKEPGKRFTNLTLNHELYCAGHMIEAAVAYYETTGKSKFLDIVCKFADYIDSVFGEEDEKLKGYPGHQEIELALVRLYRVTGEKRYLKLSQFFIDERGQQPHYFDIEKKNRGDKESFWWNNDYAYMQAHVPVREQKDPVGHSVRAVYMYTAMADLAAENHDESLWKTTDLLWDKVSQRQLYITGGIGSQAYGESFSFDYDLPNDICYTETCASVGLVFWGSRMLKNNVDRKYTDVMERALYNGILSGMDLDGKKFFYVNPLEVYPEANTKRNDRDHAKPVRQKWYACACCPPNISRMVSSIGHYIYSSMSDTAFIHLFIGSETTLDIAGQKVQVFLNTEYPWDEKVTLQVNPETSAQFNVALRIPGWCKNASLKVNGKKMDLESNIKQGYVYIDRIWSTGDQVELLLPMPVEKVKAHPKVQANTGKVALQRGPVVYCFEETDNGENLHNLRLPADSMPYVEANENLLGGIPVLQGEVLRINTEEWNGDLYSTDDLTYTEATFTAVPYFAWCNREPGEMRVWIQEEK